MRIENFSSDVRYAVNVREYLVLGLWSPEIDMSKVIRIDNCRQCPYLAMPQIKYPNWWNRSGQQVIYRVQECFCTHQDLHHPENVTPFYEKNHIPQFCPLEDERQYADPAK